MATTTNFGWETPDDTDLVKDGAAAMRTLGSAIDTSFVDLKGGTTGQNLRKATNTDLDFTWAGDATNTVVDAEGDLLVGDSADTLQRLAIGTNGYVLTVDTAVDGKIKWASASSTPTFVGCVITNDVDTTQTYASGVNQAINWAVEEIDTDGFHDNTTNNTRITIPSGKGGKYLITGTITLSDSNVSGTRYIQIAKNGTTIHQNSVQRNDYVNNRIAFVADLVAGDYIELRMRHSQSSPSTISAYTGKDGAYFSAYLIGA